MFFSSSFNGSRVVPLFSFSINRENNVGRQLRFFQKNQAYRRETFSPCAELHLPLPMFLHLTRYLKIMYAHVLYLQLLKKTKERWWLSDKKRVIFRCLSGKMAFVRSIRFILTKKSCETFPNILFLQMININSST